MKGRALPDARPVSVLIVSWNGLEYLEACLQHLRAQTHPVEQVVVVDNGSGDGSIEFLEAQPDVELLRNTENLGYAAATNQGYARCTGAYILLLNTDVELEPGYIENALAHFDDPAVGSVTGKLLRATPANTLDSTGHNVFAIGWAENRGEELPDLGFDEPHEVFGVCAAAAIYRREALEDARFKGQLLDETYFSYIEDVDLDWRLRWQGWHAWYEPAAVALHHRSATGARYSAPIMRHILKNRLLTVAKNYDAATLTRNLPGVLAFTAVKTVDFAREDPRAALGLADFARLLPHVVAYRRWLKPRRRTQPGQVSGWLKPFPWRGRLWRRVTRGNKPPA